MRRGVRGAIVGASAVGLGIAGIAAAIVAERSLVRRARSAPDPMLGEPLAERPAEQRTVRSFDGTALDVRVAEPADPGPAEGRPVLVFAHGFSLDMTTWHFQWKRLSRSYRCVLYDQRGHGRSARAGSDSYTMEALGRDLRAVLDATVPDGRAVLFGHSMGGMAVLSLAEHHPEEFGERVVGVVLASTLPGDLVREALGDMAVRASGALRRGLAAVARRPMIGEGIRRMTLARGGDVTFLAALVTNFAPGAPPSIVDHVARISAGTAPEVWPPFLRSLLDLDLADAVRNVRVPALVLVGNRDRITPLRGAHAMTDALPDGRLVVIPGAGHLAMLERPDAFTDAVDAFLAGLPGSAEVPSRTGRAAGAGRRRT